MNFFCLPSKVQGDCVFFLVDNPTNSIQRRVCSGTVRTESYRRYIYTAGITCTGRFGKFDTTSIPVLDTSVSSVRQYRYRTLQQVRYDINTGIGHFGKVGTTSIPVLPVPVQTFDNSTRHFGNFGTTSIPVPDTSISSVRHQYRYRTLR